MKNEDITLVCELEIVYKKYQTTFKAINPKYNLIGRSDVNYESALEDLFYQVKNKLWLDEKFKLEYRLKENFEIPKTINLTEGIET